MFKFIEMNKIYSILISVLLVNAATAQKLFTNIGVSVSNNTTSFPVTGYPSLFYSQFHPGVDITSQKSWTKNKERKSQFVQSIDLGFFYHRFVQSGLRIYTKCDYQYSITRKATLGIGLGVGYLQSFTATEVLELNDNGKYEQRKVYSRPQFIGLLNIGGTYRLKETSSRSISLFINFRTWLQMPFVKTYVPMLPVNSLHLGVLVPLAKNVSESTPNKK